MAGLINTHLLATRDRIVWICPTPVSSVGHLGHSASRMSQAFRFNRMNDEVVMEEKILPTEKQFSGKAALLQAVTVGLLLLLLLVVATLGGVKDKVRLRYFKFIAL